ncbi:hypothetical protein SH668x_001262 [Planctomicrobium sp. SH668]|uniref:hypothetical protein n=1 Tax=Planctomicrobium sp. SH668 TaxID=3448126 RepID=UPI003F5C34B3
MKPADYAEASKKSIEEVKAALAATGQKTHPNSEVNTDMLDHYFATGEVLSLPNQTTEQPKSQDESPADEQEAPPKTKAKSAAIAVKVRKKTSAPEVVVHGEYEEGMKIYSMSPIGRNDLQSEYLAYGHDSAQAIGNIVSEVRALKSNLVNWKVNGTRPFTVEHV